MKKKWNKDRMKEEMKEGKEEFFNLTKELMDVTVKFCLKALKTFEVGKGEELNHIQINQIATHEVEAVIEQISNPKFVNLAVEKAEMIYLQENQTLTLKRNKKF